MATIYVDNKKYEVNEKDNLLKACLSLDFNIPYFCWHPILGSIGACRQCAIKKYQNAQDTNGHLVMSCMTPAIEGTRISINDEEARKFRKNVIEWLMINHPHDCLICEEGGSCHLQDMTVMTSHNFRRYRFTKRTHRNQNLGPFISHEMNRCITCYRCVRYYKDYADGKDFGVYGVHDNIYFGRLENGILENEFSGNLIEICPTGVFTDKTYSKHYSRKWDMQFAPSICQQCSLGCNISPGERYGELRRIENRYNGTVNHYFLCDRGRFGYGYVNLRNRPRKPFRKLNGNLIVLNAEKALLSAADILRESKKVIGIGSPRASVESNFALRELVGSENFYTGITKNEQECLKLMLQILREGGVHTPTLREIESYDAVLVLGEDVTQTGARVALAVRQAVKSRRYEMALKQNVEKWQVEAIENIAQHAKYPLFITSVDSTRLDDIATWTYHASLENQARLGFAIARALDEKAPFVEGLDYNLQEKIAVITQALVSAKKPLIVTGTNIGSVKILQAAANIAKALKIHNANVGITMVARAVNSVGLAMIDGGSLDEALDRLKLGTIDAVIILENNLYYYKPAICIDKALEKTSLIIVVDHQRTPVMEKANFVFSATSFAEGNGTVINNEGRAQRFFKVYDPSYYDKSITMLDSWRWMHLLHSVIKNQKIKWSRIDHVVNAVAEAIPQLAGVKDAAPDANFRIHGQKLAREPHRYSGRTAMRANINVHEPRQPQDEDTMFSFSMEGNNSPFAPRSEIPFVWVPGWNSLQAWNKFQDEIGGHLRYGDPGVRLIEASKSTLDYFKFIPDNFQICKNSWRIAPYYYLFWSDELSQCSPLFQKFLPKPRIKLNLEEAEKLGIKEGSNVSFSYEGQIFSLPLEFSKELSPGQIGFPIGVTGIVPISIGSYINNLQEDKEV